MKVHHAFRPSMILRQRLVPPIVYCRNFSKATSGTSPLASPTDADATELFHRMNSRPESILSKDASKLAKYNQDWTVRRSRSSMTLRG
jgi:hypothetical protein